MKRSPQPRRIVNLPDSVHRRLNMYALSATAAGVGMLASAQAAEGKIVYTPTHKIIGVGDTYRLDLNRDGVTDFILTNGNWCDFVGCSYFLGGFGARSINGIAAGRLYLALALRQGARIGLSRHFFTGNRPMVSVYHYSSGNYRQAGYWINVSNRYLGLQFKIKGKFHFGWARLSVKVQKTKITATLTGYAYETIPGKSIIAGQTKGRGDAEAAASLDTPNPEPATLGALAAGAPRLSIWRRKDSVVAAPESN